jgi:hypothetical protein
MERAPNPCEAGTTRKATILQLIQFQRETMVPGVGVELNDYSTSPVFTWRCNHPRGVIGTTSTNASRAFSLANESPT